MTPCIGPTCNNLQQLAKTLAVAQRVWARKPTREAGHDGLLLRHDVGALGLEKLPLHTTRDTFTDETSMAGNRDGTPYGRLDYSSMCVEPRSRSRWLEPAGPRGCPAPFVKHRCHADGRATKRSSPEPPHDKLFAGCQSANQGAHLAAQHHAHALQTGLYPLTPDHNRNTCPARPQPHNTRLAAQHRTHGLHNGPLLHRAGAHGRQQWRVAAWGRWHGGMRACGVQGEAAVQPSLVCITRSSGV